MFSALLAVFTSSGFGALTGIFGNWVKERENRKNRELEMEHQFKMTTLQHNQTLELADKQIDIETTKGEMKGFAESQKSDKGGWMDKTRAIIRPLITVYLLTIASYLAYQVNSLVGGMEALTPSEVLVMYKEIIASVIYLTTVAVSWWFSARAVHKK